MDEMKAEALKFNLDLEEYFSAVSTRFQSASAIIIATMNGSNGPPVKYVARRFIVKECTLSWNFCGYSDLGSKQYKIVVYF
jgi:hypothetical protein